MEMDNSYRVLMGDARQLEYKVDRVVQHSLLAGEKLYRPVQTRVTRQTCIQL